MSKLGKGYIVVATLRDKNTKYFERIMCLTLKKTSSRCMEMTWSKSNATVFRFNEVPENDKNYKPWKKVSRFERYNLTCYPCAQVKPVGNKSYFHLSPSIKSPGFWAYSKSPNELAYRVAKNAMMLYKHCLGRLYECRVYRVGTKLCPVILDFNKERLYEKRMYELYSNEDNSDINHLMKTYEIAWRKNNR